jgi:DNA-binding MarR family transcriptional regulator
MDTIAIDSTASSPEDAELAILEHIYSSQKRARDITQRDLAVASGLSLGMTNALLKRFSDKGWLLLKRLNARNIQYALTSEGINEIAHRTYRYFKRTARAASLYRDMIEEFVMRKKREGVTRLVLAGVSDIDFLIEYACERHGLLFVKAIDPLKAERLGSDGSTVVVHAEGDVFPAHGVGRLPDESLSKVLVGVRP